MELPRRFTYRTYQRTLPEILNSSPIITSWTHFFHSIAISPGDSVLLRRCRPAAASLFVFLFVLPRPYCRWLWPRLGRWAKVYLAKTQRPLLARSKANRPKPSSIRVPPLSGTRESV